MSGLSPIGAGLRTSHNGPERDRSASPGTRRAGRSWARGRRCEEARVPREGTARPANLPALRFRAPPRTPNREVLPAGATSCASLFFPSETLCRFSCESLEIPGTRYLYFHKTGENEVALVETLGQCANTRLIL